jgi:hypothetical protein
MFAIEVLTRVTLGLLVVIAGIQAGVYAFALTKAVSPNTVGSLVGSLLMLFFGVWGFRKLEARSRARHR